MPSFTRRVAIALAAFVIAWLTAAIAAGWLFGSGNVLVWMLATVVGATAWLAVPWWEARRAARGSR